MAAKKYYCTECDEEAIIRYSNWRDNKGNVIVKKQESICTNCLQKRKPILRIF